MKRTIIIFAALMALSMAAYAKHKPKEPEEPQTVSLSTDLVTGDCTLTEYRTVFTCVLTSHANFYPRGSKFSWVITDVTIGINWLPYFGNPTTWLYFHWSDMDFYPSTTRTVVGHFQESAPLPENKYGGTWEWRITAVSGHKLP